MSPAECPPVQELFIRSGVSGCCLGMRGASLDVAVGRVMELAGRPDGPLTEENLYRLLVSAITDYAIYMLDPHRRRVAAGIPGAERIKGYTRRRDHRPAFLPFLHRRGPRAGAPGSGARNRRRARAASRSEGWRVRKDGTRFWAHVVIDPIRDDDGELIGFAKITRDITERRKAQQRARAGPRSAVPVAEDGGDRPADRRRRA